MPSCSRLITSMRRIEYCWSRSFEIWQRSNGKRKLKALARLLASAVSTSRRLMMRSQTCATDHEGLLRYQRLCRRGAVRKWGRADVGRHHEGKVADSVEWLRAR